MEAGQTQNITTDSFLKSGLNQKPLLILLISLEVITVFIAIFFGYKYNQLKKELSNVQTSILDSAVKDKPISVVGVVRSSGLGEDEKQQLNLSDVNYQLTDFNNNEMLSVYGYYLITNDNWISSFLGRCTKIIGTEPVEFKSLLTEDTYQRKVLSVDSFELVNSSLCSPYPDMSSEITTGNIKLILNGVIDHSNRPSPDIAYDYQLKLSKPFVDENNSSGLPQEISIVDVVPDTNNVWIKLIDNINKEVEVEGYMEWGYAESRYFKITSINII